MTRTGTKGRKHPPNPRLRIFAFGQATLKPYGKVPILIHPRHTAGMREARFRVSDVTAPNSRVPLGPIVPRIRANNRQLKYCCRGVVPPVWLSELFPGHQRRLVNSPRTRVSFCKPSLCWEIQLFSSPALLSCLLLQQIKILPHQRLHVGYVG